MTRVKRWSAMVLCVAAAGCSSGSSGSPNPTTPTPNQVPPTLTAPVPQSPANQAQLGTLRPTLTVANGTSSQAGTRVYEFQISDQSDFTSLSAQTLGAFLVVSTKTNVPEGAGGTTSYTPDEDLQPTTRFYWRARLVMGTTTSDWSPVQTFNSKLVGYNRPGELYDPLIHGETVGERIGSTTFIDGKGIRIENSNSYVRYLLPQTITNGEFSVEVEGLRPNGPGGKLRVFSMMNGTGNLFTSKFLFNVQYRGVPGNPDNAFSYKALFGDEDYKLEPDLGTRIASIRLLDPSRTYHWRATWGTGIRVIVQEGGIGGPTIYEHGQQSPGGIYNPTPHYAYLGANNGPFGEEDGSWPGVTYRNLWIGNKPRPASLGSALTGK